MISALFRRARPGLEHSARHPSGRLRIMTAISWRREACRFFGSHAEGEDKLLERLQSENASSDRLLKGRMGVILQNDARSYGDEPPPPERYGGYMYRTRSDPYTGRYKLSRWPCSGESSSGLIQEEVLLDTRKLAWELGGFAEVGTIRVSPDHNKIAYTVDSTADEVYSLRVYDTRTRTLVNVAEGENVQLVEWADDFLVDEMSETLVFTVGDENRRPYCIKRLNMRTGHVETIHTERDESVLCSVTKTKDNEFIVLGTLTKNTTQSWLLPSRTPWENPTRFWGKVHGVQYHIEHNQGIFYVVKKDMSRKLKNFELLAVDAAKVMNHTHEGCQTASARVLVSTQREVLLHDISVFRDHIAILEIQDGLPRLRVLPLNHGAPKMEEIPKMMDVHLPKDVCTLEIGSNLDFDSSFLRIDASSVVLKPTSYDVDLNSGRMWPVQQDGSHGHESRPYGITIMGESQREFRMSRLDVPTADGNNVPVTLFHRGDPRMNGEQPILMSAYGAYGALLSLEYSTHVFPLLNRGWICAFVHARGGGERGVEWYYDGRLQRKWNTFQDFIDAADCLVARGYSSPGKLAAYGASAGGMVVGVALNTRPELFGAAIADVPFVDVLGSMDNPHLPLTRLEYEEWGNPANPDDRSYMSSYDPILNVRHQAYPPVLATASVADFRVPYQGVCRWIDALRDHDTSGSDKIVRTSFDGNHFFHNSLEAQVIKNVFLLENVGAT